MFLAYSYRKRRGLEDLDEKEIDHNIAISLELLYSTPTSQIGDLIDGIQRAASPSISTRLTGTMRDTILWLKPVGKLD